MVSSVVKSQSRASSNGHKLKRPQAEPEAEQDQDMVTKPSPTPTVVVSSPENPKRVEELNRAVAQIERAFGKGAIMRLDGDPNVVIPGISTGAISLDLALGGRGLPAAAP